MRFLDRLLGRTSEPTSPPPPSPAPSSPAPGEPTDEQALERYRYLVRTAPPDAIEQAHEEAFAKLTPEQRRTALHDLSAAVPEHERGGGDDPRSLARMATRAEVNQPGTVERAFGGGRGMVGGIGGGMGGGLLGTFAAAFAGTAIAQSLFSDFGGDEGGGAEEAGSGEGDASSEADSGDADASGGDFGGGDFGGGDVGGF